MVRKIRKYWKQTLFFGAITAYYCFGLSPDMTWLGIGADQANYVVAAKFNAPAGLSGNPLYILIGSLLVRLPTNPFWSFGLLSALPAAGTCVVIYLITRRLTKSALAPYIASAVFASSFAVWAESVIAETYLITVLVMSLVVYFCMTKRYLTMGVMMALGLGLHPLGMFFVVPCLVYSWWVEGKDPKLVGKVVGIAMVGLLFRLRDVFVEPATSNLFFLENPYQNLLFSAGGYFGNAVIPIGPTIQRLGEDISVLSSSLWAIVPAVLGFLTKRKEVYLLGAILGLTFFFPFSSIYPQWAKYMVMPVLPLAILVGMGVDKLDLKRWSIVFLIPCVIFAGLNVVTYSPGKTIDPQPTTMRQFYNTLDAVQDKAIVVGHTWGHPDLVVGYYTVLNGDRFDYINWDSMTGGADRSEYRGFQKSKGIDYPGILDEEGGTLSVSEFARQLQDLNPERQVLVTYVKEGSAPMEFGLVSADDYYPGLNDVPAGKVDFVGG